MISRRTVLAGLTLAAIPALAAADTGMMDASVAHRQARAGDVIMIDVRTPGEWAQTGVPEGAHAIAMQDPDLGKKIDALTGGDRDTPVALICATGVRSGRVASALERAGYTQVYSVGEGMHGSANGPGWLRRGLPIEKAPCVRNC